jgi:sorbitol-specific phosphotransferase system component IIBC
MAITAVIGVIGWVMLIGEAIWIKAIPESFWLTALFSAGALAASGLLWLVQKALVNAGAESQR